MISQENWLSLSFQIPEQETYSDFLFDDGGNGTKLMQYRGSSYNVVIPSRCTKIGASAFDECSSLTSVIYNGTTYTDSDSLISALNENNVNCLDSFNDF